MLRTARNTMKMSHPGLSLFEKIKEIKNDIQSILILFYELKSGHIGDTLMIISGYSYNIYVLHWEVNALSNL